MYTRPVYPLPEAVDPHGDGPWGIESSSPFTPRVFPKHRFLQVPLDDSEHSRFMRNHELGHIRWSHKHPDLIACKHKINLDVLQAVEDLRVNTRLLQLTIDVSSGGLPREVATSIAKNLMRRGDLRSMILTMVAAQGCGANEQHFHRMFEVHPFGSRVVRLAEMARKALWSGGTPRFKDTIRVAKWLQLMLENIEEHHSFRLARGLGFRADDASRFDQVLKIGSEFGAGGRALHKVPWGLMQVQTPPRLRRVNGYIGRGKIASEEGTLPRYLYRHLVDGRVFQRVRRRRGGTVLIDCSGSMSLETSDLKRILEHSPGACVAAYSGNDRDGVLRILAACGRQVEDRWIAAPAGGANVVDGPALQWLSKQQKPRIWVSDGQVTGIHDRMSAINSLECMDVCRRHRVVRHPNMHDAVAALSQLG